MEERGLVDCSLPSAQPLPLQILTFAGGESTYNNKHPVREDRQHVSVPPECGQLCSLGCEGGPAEFGKEAAVATPPTRQALGRLLTFGVLFYVAEFSHSPAGLSHGVAIL